MSKIPISYSSTKDLEYFFYDILTFHIPFGKNVSILDPTCGKKHLWKKFFRRTLSGTTSIDKYKKVIFSDIKDYDQEIVSDFNDLEFDHEFDCIVFDPPYLFGYEKSDDPRRDDYGDYRQSYGELFSLMFSANILFPRWLKNNGKVIFKCSDQYQVKERKFYPLHVDWVNCFNNFKLIDFFVFGHHRMNPRAFQVKGRPCSVIMHTYFMVFELEQTLSLLIRDFEGIKNGN